MRVGSCSRIRHPRRILFHPILSLIHYSTYHCVFAAYAVQCTWQNHCQMFLPSQLDDFDVESWDMLNVCRPTVFCDVPLPQCRRIVTLEARKAYPQKRRVLKGGARGHKGSDSAQGLFFRI